TTSVCTISGISRIPRSCVFLSERRESRGILEAFFEKVGALPRSCRFARPRPFELADRRRCRFALVRAAHPPRCGEGERLPRWGRCFVGVAVVEGVGRDRG